MILELEPQERQEHEGHRYSRRGGGKPRKEKEGHGKGMVFITVPTLRAMHSLENVLRW